MKVVVTIPAFNEEGTIGRVIEDVKKVMDGDGYDYDVLVVDDGSEDKTASEAKKAGAGVYSHPMNYGLAETFRTEIEKALELNPDVIVHTDADRQYLARDIPKLINEVKNDYDLVLGSRFLGEIEYMPFVKRVGNRAFSKVVSRISGVKITDAQTGFRAFTREFAGRVKVTSSHTYTQEQIIRAVREKYRVMEVPIYFAKRTQGESRLISSPFSYAFSAGVNILRIYRDYEPLKFFGSIGIALLFLGLLLGSYPIILFLTSSFERLDRMVPTVILTLFLLLSGLQILLFGFLADKK